MAGDKSAEAVQALHKTMVLLRDELAKKNQTIQTLERRLHLNQNKITIETEEGDVIEEQEEVIEEIDDLIREDPVMEFHLSEDENEENPEVKIHTLIVHKDIDLHQEPMIECSTTRPILRSISKSPRSCAGSQTDITALFPLKTWSSEPSIKKPPEFELPSMNYRKAVIDWDAFDRLKQFDDVPILNAEHSSGGSTDSLLEEANDYLFVAQQKVVTCQDWKEIDARRETRKQDLL